MKKKSDAAKPMRVWIELDYPKDKADGDRRAELATMMLRRLGDSISKFWWYQDKHCYCITIDSAGGYMTCSDNGHWFNLEFMAGVQG